MMLTDFAIKLVAKWSWEWIKMECKEGKCYGVLAVCSPVFPCDCNFETDT